MSIRVQCPNADCGKVTLVKDELAGKRGKCGCGTIVIVPNRFPSPARPAAGPAPAVRRPGMPPPGRVGHVPARAPARAPRSGMVTAIAIVNFVLAGLSILMGLVFLLFGGLVSSAGRMSNELEKLASQELGKQGMAFQTTGVGSSVAFVGTLIMILSIASLLWGAAAIPSGIGLIKRRNWGRILSLILAVVAGLMGLASVAPVFMGGGFGTIFGALLYAGYTAWVFLVLLRARVRREFA
jgi:hypothetical protein